MNIQTMQRIGGAVAAIVLTATPAEAFAWEQDVHYGLTRYLAQQAAWNLGDADTIALANQAVDDNNETAAAWLMVHKVIPGSQAEAEQASQRVRFYHFPSAGSLPAPPEQRAVVSDASAPQQRVQQAVKAGDLVAIGTALHALQDSWSHQGCPDKPIRLLWNLRESLAWSHPERRGGWYSHNADLTSWQRNTPPGETECKRTSTNNIDVTLDMARETFLILKVPGGKASDWSSIKDDVKQFAEANTIDAKRRWFKTKFSDHSGFRYGHIEKINLPREDWAINQHVDKGAQGFGFTLITPAQAQTDDSPRFKCTPSTETRRSEELKAFARWFLNTWLTDGATAMLVQNAIDIEQIKASLTPFEDRRPEAQEWVGKFLTLWLIDDHGAVNALGHGMPVPGYEALPANLGEARKREFPVRLYQTLADALIPITDDAGDDGRRFIPDGRHYGIVALPATETLPGVKGTVFLISMRFADYSHDSLGLAVACQSEGAAHAWKVVRFVWEAM